MKKKKKTSFIVLKIVWARDNEGRTGTEILEREEEEPQYKKHCGGTVLPI